MQISFLSLGDVSPEIESQIEQLFAELSSSKPISVKDLLSSSNPPYIAICSENQKVIAMATMAVYQVISGKKAWIEDVVVSENYRKKGIGEKLTLSLLNKAKEIQASAVLLYSNPKREAAHRLYKRLGFVEKGSTLFINYLD